MDNGTTCYWYLEDEEGQPIIPQGQFSLSAAADVIHAKAQALESMTGASD